MKNMKTVGFVTSWMQNDVEEQETQNLDPIQQIVNDGNRCITNAHAELLARIHLTEAVIMGKAFIKFTKEKKMEFLEELKWLTSLNAQLSV